MMTIDCVAYLMTYELHVLEVNVYGTSNEVLYCMDSTLQRLRAVCAATARLLFFLSFFFSTRNLRAPSADYREKNFGRFHTTSDFDREYAP